MISFIGFVLFCLLLLRGQEEGLADHFAAVDGGAQAVELLLVAGHDANDPVLMEVPGQGVHLQAAGGELLQAELEEGALSVL